MEYYTGHPCNRHFIGSILRPLEMKKELVSHTSSFFVNLYHAAYCVPTRKHFLSSFYLKLCNLHTKNCESVIKNISNSQTHLHTPLPLQYPIDLLAKVEESYHLLRF